MLVSELDAVCINLDDLERRLTIALQEPLPFDLNELQAKVLQHQVGCVQCFGVVRVEDETGG